jgi:hypothetical protein
MAFQKGHKAIGKPFQKGHGRLRKFYFPLTKKHKRKISESEKGRVCSEETRKKLIKNNSRYWFGKKRPEIAGKNNYNWKDGIGTWKGKIKHQEKIAGRKKPKQCEICGAIGQICFDHDHITENFRGWICHRCNLVLGLVKDNSELLLKLSEYLKNEKSWTKK